MFHWEISKKRRFWPRTLQMILLCAIIVFGVGCGVESDETTPVSSPPELDYLITNPITIEEVGEGDDQNFSYTYLTISGLKDQDVQQKINDRIKEVYDQLRVQDLPPYRGIKTFVPEGSVIVSEYIHTYAMGNFNHILSIAFDKSTNWKTGDGEISSEEDEKFYEFTQYVSEVETLTFDLNTGKEIKITELFDDDVESMEMLNGEMHRRLARSGAEEEGLFFDIETYAKLVESFKGLSADQKFGVGPSGLSIILDHQTPQFDTGLSAERVFIDLDKLEDHLAVAGRFYDESRTANLFDAPVKEKSLVEKHSDTDFYDADRQEEGHLSVTHSYKYSSQLPEKIKNKLQEAGQVDEDKVNVLRQLEKQRNIVPHEEYLFFYEILVEGSQYGKYINVAKIEQSYHPDAYETNWAYSCYDAETLKELQLGEIFREGYDYKAVILEEIKDYLGNNGGAKEMDAVFASIKGFNLFAEHMIIPINYVNEEKNIGETQLFIPYEKFGCEHMVIFH